LPDLGGSAPSVTRLRDNAGADGDESPAATRITLRPHDPGTGEEIEKREVVKGYEYSRGQFLTFIAEELKALDVESSKVVDLEKFVAGGDIDPVYVDSPYHDRVQDYSLAYLNSGSIFSPSLVPSGSTNFLSNFRLS
jgi:hypothetical protein